MALYTQIAIGGILGVIAGLILGDSAGVLEPFGTLFIQLLQMLIIPLVITSILAGMLKLQDSKAVGKVGGGFIIYLIMTSLFATTIGVLTALIIQPGKEQKEILEHGEAVESEEFNFIDHFLSWIPTNIFESLANMDMLPIIIFTIIIGLILLTMGHDNVPTLVKFINEGANVMLKLTEHIIKLAPYGIFALVANMVGTFGSDMLSAAISFIIADYVAMLVVFLVIYPIMLKVTTGLSPFQFFKNVYPSTLFAFTTSTSSATIPISLAISKKNLGTTERTSGFTIPFGATVNMDGFAVAIGVISVFAANLYSMPITFSLIVQFVLLGLVLSIGAAGVRGAGIVFSIVLLESVGMPLTLIPVLAAIWPIIDMGHTALNITGDLNGTTIVAKKTGDLDEDVFNAKNKKINSDSQKVF